MIKQAIAPLRISFAGGGTDVEPYCTEKGGAVISAAIEWYTYAKIMDKHEENELESIVRNACDPESKPIRVNAECQPMSGLGGSASAFVAGIKLLQPQIDPYSLAQKAFFLERKVMGVTGGSQDQYAAALGGFNYMSFGANGKVSVQRLIPPVDLEKHLYLVYLGTRNHSGHDIIQDQMSHINYEAFAMQKQTVEAMKTAIEKGNTRLFGLFMNMAWVSKKQFSPYITTPAIDKFHADCMAHGAIAGKLTGAGGGGYMLLMADPQLNGMLLRHLQDKGIAYHRVKFDYEGARCV